MLRSDPGVVRSNQTSTTITGVLQSRYHHPNATSATWKAIAPTTATRVARRPPAANATLGPNSNTASAPANSRACGTNTSRHDVRTTAKGAPSANAS